MRIIFYAKQWDELTFLFGWGVGFLMGAGFLTLGLLIGARWLI